MKDLKSGKLQLGSEAVQVEYELETTLRNNRRETTGTLVLKQTPVAELSTALTNMTGANLIAESEVRWIEFTRNECGSVVRFVALPPKGR